MNRYRPVSDDDAIGVPRTRMDEPCPGTLLRIAIARSPQARGSKGWVQLVPTLWIVLPAAARG